LTRITNWEVFEDLEDEDDAKISQIVRIAHYLKCLPVRTVAIDKAEADDIIAYYSDILPKAHGSKVFIVSSDKDFIQLVNDDVIVYRPIEKEYYTKDTVKEKFGVLADNFILYKILLGDNSDKVAGVKGLGEKGLLKKFTGDSGKRVVIMFNKSKENSADIQNLGTTMLTKEDFTNINNLIQQEIFASHQITSPALFGIKTEGQLGSRTEIRDAYEIFNNTYVAERQDEFNQIFTDFRNLKGEVGEFNIVPLEPLKFEFTEAIMVANLTQNEIRELMGREPLQVGQVTSDGETAVIEQPVQQAIELPASNEYIKNLSGRQYQNVMRIVRQFGNGKLSKEQAGLMLKNGFGFTDNDVNTFLGLDDNPLTDDEVQKFSMSEDERMIEYFENCGAYDFNEVGYDRINFEEDLTQTQASVLDLITKDKNITPEVISQNLKILILI
jgi:hypothetical protein